MPPILYNPVVYIFATPLYGIYNSPSIYSVVNSFPKVDTVYNTSYTSKKCYRGARINNYKWNYIRYNRCSRGINQIARLAGSGSHSVILPAAASYTGQRIYLWNMNSSSNSWTFSSSITLPNGTTTNSISNQSTIELISDGNVWLKWN